MIHWARHGSRLWPNTVGLSNVCLLLCNEFPPRIRDSVSWLWPLALRTHRSLVLKVFHNIDQTVYVIHVFLLGTQRPIKLIPTQLTIMAVDQSENLFLHAFSGSVP